MMNNINYYYLNKKSELLRFMKESRYNNLIVNKFKDNSRKRKCE